MKLRPILLTTAALLAAGCNKPEEANTPAPEVKHAEAVAPEQAAPTALPEGSGPARAATSDGQANLTSRSQQQIDEAKRLVAQNRWAEALRKINDLAGARLTPEQQATVDKLKEQAIKVGRDVAVKTVEAAKDVGTIPEKR